MTKNGRVGVTAIYLRRPRAEYIVAPGLGHIIDKLATHDCD